jgi:beta-lactamase class A
MTYLREAEKNPGLLDRKFYLAPGTKVPQQTFNEKYLEPGHSYSVKELLSNMIVKSDNYATLLLNQNANFTELGKFFETIGIPAPDMKDRSYTVTIKEYNKGIF